MKEKNQSKLDKLKKDYEVIKKKYNLPEFKDLNNDFEIEKLIEKETDFLLRNIRREIFEKIANYMKFLEALINPANAPLLFMALCNQMTEKEKKIVNELYIKFSKYFIKSIFLDNESDEKKEAILILEIYKDWKEIKKQFSDLIEIFDSSFEKKKEKKIKNYIS